jgi:hypothetical protein
MTLTANEVMRRINVLLKRFGGSPCNSTKRISFCTNCLHYCIGIRVYDPRSTIELERIFRSTRDDTFFRELDNFLKERSL